MHYRVLEYYQFFFFFFFFFFFSNGDPVLLFTYFMAMSNLVPYAFVSEKGETMGFSETVVVYDIKVGRCC